LSSPVQKKKSTSEGENYANSGLDECEWFVSCPSRGRAHYSLGMECVAPQLAW
jgi:hypothetical protein